MSPGDADDGDGARPSLRRRAAAGSRPVAVPSAGAREVVRRPALEQAAAVLAGEVTAPDLLAASLARLTETQPLLGAFRTVLDTGAAVAAADAQAVVDAAADDAGRRRLAETRPLLGVPVAVKDSMAVAGQPRRLGTDAVVEPEDRDSRVVEMLREAGAVVVGTTHVPELTLWPFTEGPAFPAVRNPHDLSRTPGGSSGGSAAAVAAGVVGLATGSDGGGSLRIPAACCGLVGLLPTQGRVPLAPDDGHWEGLSSAGVLSRTVADTALALDVLSGPVPGERRAPALRDALSVEPGHLRVGWSVLAPVPLRPAPQVAAAVQSAGAVLRAAGHDVRRADPDWERADLAFVPRYLRGAASDLASLGDPSVASPSARTVARLGRLVPGPLLSASHAAAAALERRLEDLFERVDVLVTPVLARPAVEVGRWRRSGGVARAATVSRWMGYAPPWNAVGWPSMSVPLGVDEGGLPLAVMLGAPAGREARLLQVAALLESAVDEVSRADGGGALAALGAPGARG